jgi:hypothetical protein
MNKKYLISFGIIISLGCSVLAQVNRNSELFKTLKKMDSILFERGFNQCDLISLDNMVHSDFEFYHDTGGKNDKSEFMNATRENICNDPEFKPIRKLVEESLKVYRLEDNGILYGAIQIGEHLFYIKENEKELYQTNIAKFTHVWILENDEWLLSRVLSYDHQNPNSE